MPKGTALRLCHTTWAVQLLKQNTSHSSREQSSSSFTYKWWLTKNSRRKSAQKCTPIKLNPCPTQNSFLFFFLLNEVADCQHLYCPVIISSRKVGPCLCRVKCVLLLIKHKSHNLSKNWNITILEAHVRLIDIFSVLYTYNIRSKAWCAVWEVIKPFSIKHSTWFVQHYATESHSSEILTALTHFQ